MLAPAEGIGLMSARYIFIINARNFFRLLFYPNEISSLDDGYTSRGRRRGLWH
jgi:hypothetical protein